MATVTRLIPGRTVLFVCDVQTRFRTLVHGFDHVVATGTKMLKLAKVCVTSTFAESAVLDLPVIVTEQNPRALGPTVPELNTAPLESLFLGAYEKTAFSMAIPPVIELLEKNDFKSVILFGIESHVCVLQSALDLLERGYDVHVLADGVSSTRKEEIPIAIERMRRAGAQITTSESAAFELQADANKPNFKLFSGIIKEEGETTRKALEGLVSAYSKW